MTAAILVTLVLLVGLFVLVRVTAKRNAAVATAPGVPPARGRTHPAVRAVLGVIGVLVALGNIGRMIHNYRLNEAVIAIAGAPVVTERIAVGGLSVTVPAGYSRLTTELAAEVDRNVGDAVYSNATAQTALVLMPRDPSSDRHPLATMFLVDALSTDTDPASVTATWCRQQGDEVAATTHETLMETEVLPLPFGTSCRVRTSDPELPAWHTFTWILVVPGQDDVVVCSINSRSPRERETCESLVMGAELLPSA